MRLACLVALIVVPGLAIAQTSSPATTAARDASLRGKPWTARVRQGETLYATFQTTAGDVTVRLFTREAPKTVENFVALATGEKEWVDPRTAEKTRRPLYDGTLFHRVIPNFMIQGGDPLGQGIGGPGFQFEDELLSGRKFDKPCLLAMANSGPNTNGSQFFITEKPTPWLNNHHTIFGEGVKGCEVVGKIAHLPASETRPVTDVILKKIVISEKAPSP